MARCADRPDAEGLERAAALWERASRLYRATGQQDKYEELKTLLIALHRRIYSRFADTQTSQDEGAVGTFSRWGMFFKIGCFGFGGPMAVFTLLEDELVTKEHILTNEDFLDGAVLGDVLPGPVTMDIVAYTGYKLNKWLGALTSTSVFVLPSFVLMILFAMLYDSYRLAPQVDAVFTCLAAAVTGLIASVALKLGSREVRDSRGVCIVLGAFILSFVLALDIVVVIGLAGLAGVFLYRDDSEE